MVLSLPLIIPFSFKKALSSSIVLVFKTLFWISTIALFGAGSSWYFIHTGTKISTESYGPWKIWRSVAQPDTDPYTQAHFLLDGSLPYPSDVAETYFATKDTEGKSLHSSCDYKIESAPQSFLIWSLAVFTSQGKVIKNPANRYSYTNTTAALDENGRFVAILSRTASPGNWLPTGGAGYLSVVFTVLSTKQKYELKPLDYLPQFVRLSCR